jgi:hypothetical protein
MSPLQTLTLVILAAITSSAFTLYYCMVSAAKRYRKGKEDAAATLLNSLVEHHDRVLLASYELGSSDRPFKEYCDRVNTAIELDVKSGRKVSQDVDALLFVKRAMEAKVQQPN